MGSSDHEIRDDVPSSGRNLYCEHMRSSDRLAGSAIGHGKRRHTPTWTVSDSITAPITAIQSVACPSSTDCYAVGDNSNDEYPTDSGIIFISTDGGTTWTSQSDPSGTTTLNDITCPSTTTCYATGANNAINPPAPTVVSTTDGGITWIVDALPAGPRSVKLISCPSSTTCFAVGGQQLGSLVASDNQWRGNLDHRCSSSRDAQVLRHLVCISDFLHGGRR